MQNDFRISRFLLSGIRLAVERACDPNGGAGVTDEETGHQTPAALSKPNTAKHLGILGVCHFFVTLQKTDRDSSLRKPTPLAGARPRKNVGLLGSK